MTKKIKLKISARLAKKKMRRSKFTGKKHCRFCGNEEHIREIDFKNATFLRSFMTERSKILPSRISGNCAQHQRGLARAIREARTMALLPYVTQYF
jgi:small subunit ribosomal protein S18